MYSRVSISLIIFTFLSIPLFSQNALNFDGVNDRLTCGNNPSVQLSGALTLEAWIYPTAWQSQVWQGNIINKEQNSPDYGYMLRCGDNGRLNFNLGNGSWHEITTAANTLSLNTWQHVAATYDGSMMRLYLNAVLVDSMSLSISFTSIAQNLTVGNWSNPGTDRCFSGSIDEARVWSMALSRSEILSGMNGELCSSSAGLAACYRLNEGVASGNNTGVNTTSDFSGNGNHGTLSNFALNGSSSNWVTGASITPGSSFTQITANGCNFYSGPGGILYDSTGIYLDTLQSVHGCDSVIETDLIMKFADTSVTTTSVSLSSNQINAAYKWMDCNDNYKLVPGGTNRVLFPPDPSGSYAVQVDFGGCVDTSACHSLVGVSLNELSGKSWSVYPNPTRGLCRITLNTNERADIEMYDLAGSLILKTSATGDLDVQLSRVGTFILKIQHGSDLRVERIVNLGN